MSSLPTHLWPTPVAAPRPPVGAARVRVWSRDYTRDDLLRLIACIVVCVIVVTIVAIAFGSDISPTVGIVATGVVGARWLALWHDAYVVPDYSPEERALRTQLVTRGGRDRVAISLTLADAWVRRGYTLGEHWSSTYTASEVVLVPTAGAAAWLARQDQQRRRLTADADAVGGLSITTRPRRHV